MEEDLHYWVDSLSQAPSALDFPTDRPRSSLRTRTTATELFELTAPEPDLATLVTAWATLLCRHSGQSQVVVGTPSGGSLALMPVVVDVSDDPEFAALSQQLVAAIGSGREHAGVPFDRLVVTVGEGAPGRTPLYQTMCGEGAADASLDLSLTIDRASQVPTLALTYDASLFDRSRMTDALAQLDGLLLQASETPRARVMKMSLVSAAARAVLPDPTAPLGDTWYGAVSSRFSEVASAHPSRLAVRDTQDSWTYGELEERSNQLARHLLASGCARGDRVAIVAHRSASLAWAVLGVLKAGTAFVMLDPAYPAARLIAILEAARPRAVVCVVDDSPLDAALAAWISSASLATRVDLPRKAGSSVLFGDLAKAPPDVVLGPDDLAYVAFTSGSTGRPKGVLGRHGPLSHFQPWRVRQFGLLPDDRVSMLSGLAHDPLHRDLFTPLQLGASLHIPDNDEVRMSGRLAAWMADEGITVTHLTPQFAQLLADASGPNTHLDALRRVFVVGDALTRNDVEQLRRIAPSAMCINYYGATETQQALSFYVVDESSVSAQTMPLGRGSEDVQLLVVTPSQQLAGIGELGELYFRSPHLAAGYLDDPELTAARFLDNPFRASPRDRVYRTGDLGRYTPTGVVEFAGRGDRQVKVRGFRVELADIEGVLGRHPSVRDVAVDVHPGPTGEPRLVAYVAPRDHAVLAPEDLRAFLLAELPEYMVPTVFVAVDTLPMTPNGKLDRRALPSPSMVPPSSGVAPRTPLEELVAGIFAGVLRVEPFGILDDFFAMGGHSLLAMQVVARLREATGHEVSVRALFEAPTPAALAAHLVASEHELSPPPILAMQDDASIVTSFVQDAIIAWEAKREPSVTWSAALRLRVEGPLDLGALREAVTRLLCRQAALRLTVDLRGSVVTKGLASTDQPLVSRRTPPGESAPDAWVDRFCDEQGSKVPFALDGSPLVRFFALERAVNDHVVLVTWHQLVHDPTAEQLIATELFEHYGAVLERRAPRLSPQLVRYSDYAAWERAWFDGAGKPRIDVARARIAAVPPLTIADHSKPVGTAAHNQRFVLDAEQGVAFARTCAAAAVSPFMGFAAAVAIVLARWSGQEVVPFMAPVSLRNMRIELDGLLGRFLNWIPIVVSVEGDPTLGELFARTRRAVLEAYSNEWAPAARVFDSPQVFEHPLNRALVNMQSMEEELPPPIATCGVTVVREPVMLRSGARNDLAFVFGTTGGSFYAGARGAAHAFDAATITEKVDELRRCLLSLDPTLSISRVG